MHVASFFLFNSHHISCQLHQSSPECNKLYLTFTDQINVHNTMHIVALNIERHTLSLLSDKTFYLFDHSCDHSLSTVSEWARAISQSSIFVWLFDTFSACKVHRFLWSHSSLCQYFFWCHLGLLRRRFSGRQVSDVFWIHRVRRCQASLCRNGETECVRRRRVRKKTKKNDWQD